MGIFGGLKSPVFVKESSNARKQLEVLKKLFEQADGETKKQIEQDMKMVSYGIAGEEAIAFELKNSFMPLLVLHDLYFEVDGMSAQIDYIIITKKAALIVECKNLIGDIEINNQGEFIRTYTWFGKKKREGIYSPVTQNQRHLDVIRAMQLKNRNFFVQAFINKTFQSQYHSVVVLANPKSVLHTKYAKRDVRDKVIRCDQLIEYIKKLNAGIRDVNMTDKQMYALADFFMRFHKEKETDYAAKYQMSFQKPLYINLEESKVISEPERKETEEQKLEIPIEETALYQKLKAFRLDMSRAYQMKPYYIYNNTQMEDIVQKKPQSVEELKQISGFGDAKCEKWGAEIVELVKKWG